MQSESTSSSLCAVSYRNSLESLKLKCTSHPIRPLAFYFIYIAELGMECKFAIAVYQNLSDYRRVCVHFSHTPSVWRKFSFDLCHKDANQRIHLSDAVLQTFIQPTGQFCIPYFLLKATSSSRPCFKYFCKEENLLAIHYLAVGGRSKRLNPLLFVALGTFSLTPLLSPLTPVHLTPLHVKVSVKELIHFSPAVGRTMDKMQDSEQVIKTSLFTDFLRLLLHLLIFNVWSCSNTA